MFIYLRSILIRRHEPDAHVQEVSLFFSPFFSSSKEQTYNTQNVDNGMVQEKRGIAIVGDPFFPWKKEMIFPENVRTLRIIQIINNADSNKRSIPPFMYFDSLFSLFFLLRSQREKFCNRKWYWFTADRH